MLKPVLWFVPFLRYTDGTRQPGFTTSPAAEESGVSKLRRMIIAMGVLVLTISGGAALAGGGLIASNAFGERLQRAGFTGGTAGAENNAGVTVRGSLGGLGVGQAANALGLSLSGGVHGAGLGGGIGEGEGDGEGMIEGQPDGEGEVEGEGQPEGEGQADGEGDILFAFHSADQNGDNLISLSELLRVIQFFNSGGYRCSPGTEDGYGPGLGDTNCVPHNSDYNPQNWIISLSELLRLIQFFNAGGYFACPDAATEDGFCPGPPPEE